MITENRLYTVEEFERFVELPENNDRLFEFIGGDIYEVPSNPYSSKIAALIIIAIGIFLRDHDLGHITTEEGGYVVSGERYAPDVAFISKARQPELPRQGYNPLPPDLAVEVVSPSDSPQKVTTKVGNYLAAGTVVWVVYPQSKQVAIHVSGQPVKTLDEKGILDGGNVLPGFKMAVKDIF